MAAPRDAGSSRRLVMDVELAAPPAALHAHGYTHASVVARLHGIPLGQVEVELPAQGSPDVVRQAVETSLAEQIQAHLRDDGIRTAADAAPEDHYRCRQRLVPPSPAPLVSVVVPTRDRADLLASCITSLQRLSYPSLEIIVVDNAPSDDSTRSMVERSFGDDNRIRYLRESRAGASHARNVGAQAARGELVAFTDDDAEVDPLWVSALVAGFRREPRVMCVTGLTLPRSLETPAQQAFEEYGGMGLGFEPRVYDLDGNRGDTLLYPYTAGVFGASNNVAFRRDLFLEHQGFDESLGPATPAFGAEDLDLFLALILDGHQIAYEPAAVVRHDHRSDFDELYWQVFTYSAGLTVLLTKWALSDRAVALDLARRVPRLLPAAFLRAHRGGAEVGVGDYPPELRRLERAGYLYGPVAYARSRRVARRGRR